MLGDLIDASSVGGASFELGSAAFRHKAALGCVVIAPETEDGTAAGEDVVRAAVEKLAELLPAATT